MKTLTIKQKMSIHEFWVKVRESWKALFRGDYTERQGWCVAWCIILPIVIGITVHAVCNPLAVR